MAQHSSLALSVVGCGSIDNETARQAPNANQFRRDVMEQRSETSPRFCICGVILTLRWVACSRKPQSQRKRASRTVRTADSQRTTSCRHEVCRAKREIFDGVASLEGRALHIFTAAIPASSVMSRRRRGSFPWCWPIAPAQRAPNDVCLPCTQTSTDKAAVDFLEE